MPNWFITGCSTGFGRELARAVLARGDSAMLTARGLAAASGGGAAVESATPPFRLILGRSAVQRIRAELEARLREIDAWVDTYQRD